MNNDYTTPQHSTESFESFCQAKVLREEAVLAAAPPLFRLAARSSGTAVVVFEHIRRLKLFRSAGYVSMRAYAGAELGLALAGYKKTARAGCAAWDLRPDICREVVRLVTEGVTVVNPAPAFPAVPDQSVLALLPRAIRAEPQERESLAAAAFDGSLKLADLERRLARRPTGVSQAAALVATAASRSPDKVEESEVPPGDAAMPADVAAAIVTMAQAERHLCGRTPGTLDPEAVAVLQAQLRSLSEAVALHCAPALPVPEEAQEDGWKDRGGAIGEIVGSSGGMGEGASAGAPESGVGHHEVTVSPRRRTEALRVLQQRPTAEAPLEGDRIPGSVATDSLEAMRIRTMAAIISASRRTDIPRYFSRWFAERRREGFAEFCNAFGGRGRVSLRAENVIGFLFWTRDSRPFSEPLHALRDADVPHAFQYTLTALGRDLEPHAPERARALDDFRARSRALPGPECIQWRYDPIVLSDRYTPDFHRRSFGELARELAGATRVVNVSIVEPYLKTVGRIADPSVQFRTLHPQRHGSVARRWPELRQVDTSPAGGHHLARKSGAREA